MIQKHVAAISILLPLTVSAAPASWDSEPWVFPDSANVVKVTDFGAIPDDGKDDTAAINKAFAKSHNLIVYFPPGTYDVSDTIDTKKGPKANGNWAPHSRRFMFGHSQKDTVIRLADGAVGFDDPKKTKVVVNFAAGTSNTSFENHIDSLTISCGKNNPGATALRWIAHNRGIIKNVVLEGMEAGAIGLDLTVKGQGPYLVQNLAIRGFDTSILSTTRQYGVTFTNLKIEKPRIIGIDNSYQSLFIEDLAFEGDPELKTIAVRHRADPGDTNKRGLITIAGGKFTGGNPETTAIVNEDGSALFATDISAEGFANTISSSLKRGEEPQLVSEKTIPFFCSHPTMGGGEKPLSLPVEHPPVLPRGPVSDWVNIVSHGAIPTDWKDDTKAIQAAFDKAAAEGKTTVVFPLSKHRHQRPAIYTVNETIRVHGSVTNVVGMYSDIALTPGFADSGIPLFSVENITRPGIRFESFNVSSGWPPKENFVSVHNAGDNTIVLTHTGLGGKAYTNEPGKGKLFIENVCAKGWDFKGTEVWARQLNPESGGADVDYGANKHSIGNIEATGTDLWILGLKTEGEKTALAIHDKSRAEIIGGFIFPYRNTVQDVPGFLVEDSSLTASFVNDQNRYKPVFRIKNGENSKDISNDGTVHIWGGNGLIVPLFVTP